MRLEPAWARRRAEHHGLHGHKKVSAQRRAALFMTTFSSGRVAVWTVGMLLMGAHFVLPHNAFLRGYYHLCSAVAFVTFLSLYCNWSTDLANFAASIAALFSADTHADSEAVRAETRGDTAALERDIAQLAQLKPGPESDELVTTIRRRLRA